MDGMGSNNELKDIKSKIIEIQKKGESGVLGCVFTRDFSNVQKGKYTNLSIAYIANQDGFTPYTDENASEKIKGCFYGLRQEVKNYYFDLSTNFGRGSGNPRKPYEGFENGMLVFVSACSGKDQEQEKGVKITEHDNYILLDVVNEVDHSKGLTVLGTLKNITTNINFDDSKPNDINAAVVAVLQPVLEELKREQNEMSEDIDLAAKIKEKIQSNRQIVFTGAPGTGKTFCIRKAVKELTGSDETRYKFVQFHSSYDYTDFVEGLRPITNKEEKTVFVRLDGTFKKFCRKVAEDTEKEYYFIIDEINRADLSKVFGELMFGLEEDYRGAENRFTTQYANLDTYKANGDKMEPDCFKEGFFIPENLTIIGSMNDIDRSVESFDFALRRRFVWEDIEANRVMLKSLEAMSEGNWSDAKKKRVACIKKMNQCISNADFGLTEAYHIGPAYFKDFAKCKDEDIVSTLTDIFAHRIEPTLREYTRGRRGTVVDGWIKECKAALLAEAQEPEAEGSSAGGDGGQNG